MLYNKNKATNLLLIDLLTQEIYNYPKQRFTQILINLEFIVPTYGIDGMINGIEDEYYLNSEVLLDRVRKAIKKRI